MRRIIVLLLSAVLICLCSCELTVNAPGPGKMHILVYGNDYRYGTYEGKNPQTGKDRYAFTAYYAGGERAGSGHSLEGTVNDAYQVGLALCALAAKAGYEYDATFILGTESKSVADPNAHVINDVSKAEFLSVLDGIASESENSDITLVYFSGHGFGSESKAAYGTDTSETSYLALRRDAYSVILYPVSDFLSRMELIKGTKVIIGDFCHSGGLVRPGNVSITAGEYDGIDSITLLREYGDGISESSSLFCLSAARYYERSHEPGDGSHGYFTRALLEGLGWNEESQTLGRAKAMVDNRITLFNLAKYAKDNDREKSGDPQNPMTSGGSNDIILFSF